MKYLILCLLPWFLSDAASGQCPPNLDFEKGDFSNWQCAIGTTYSDNGQNVIDLKPSAPVPGRHEIISAASQSPMDPYGNFPRLCPYGSNYSVKLGNDQVGSEAEGISYTFRIPATADTLTFTYFYAVVFEDPQHSLYDQPRFFVTAYDVLTGEVINCASYNYVSTSSLPGFKHAALNNNVLYKDWSPVSLQFAGLNGRLVRLEFKTGDCTQGGHFGYAYLDVGTDCSNILATAPYCAETNSLILNAPYGFKDYTWFNEDYTKVVGTGQTITFSPPPFTKGTFFVDMVPYPGFGCRDTASATVVPLPVPKPPEGKDEIVFCQFDLPRAITAIPLKEHQLLWYSSATGGMASTDAPIPSTSVTDTTAYYVSQKTFFGCESLRKKITVIIRPTPITSFTLNASRQCQKGNQFVLSSTSTNLSNSRLTWDFGDGNKDSSNSASISYSYKNYGNFDITLQVLNQPACSSNMTTSVVVIPAPVADFSYPEVICENKTDVVLTDKSYTPGNVGVISDWSWDVDGTLFHSRQPNTYRAGAAGELPVSLWVTTAEGCFSDTIKRQLGVHHQPVAAFGFKNSLCENEHILLMDKSFLPVAAIGEAVMKWNWEYDNQPGDRVQHPVQHFDAGTHLVRLTAETNFGCTSSAVERNIIVHPKPGIALQISDSCVLRTIRYDVDDATGLAVKWYWDFGNGLKPGMTSFSRSYQMEGDHSLVLIGESGDGCRDTIIRPFRIYDNKSFAGYDTVVARNQPVYLNAGGGDHVMYNWSPADGLSDPSVERPVAILDRDQRYTLNSMTDKGCDSHSDIWIKRYKGPDIYIPNAFTPNRDGKNDILKVVPIGIKSFTFFAVYNRYGQQVYYSTDQLQGWDGTLHGRTQDSGAYVAVVKAIDYNGNTMMRRETLMLIR